MATTRDWKLKIQITKSKNYIDSIYSETSQPELGWIKISNFPLFAIISNHVFRLLQNKKRFEKKIQTYKELPHETIDEAKRLPILKSEKDVQADHQSLINTFRSGSKEKKF